MDSYKQILFNANIEKFSPIRYANQTPDAVDFFVGIGGTGIDCILKIKNQIYSSIVPDDDDSSNEIYSHVKFLGIDSAAKHKQLPSSEYYPLTCYPSARAQLLDPQIDKIPYFNWLNRDGILSYLTPADSGDGIRQLGRFLIMENSDELWERLNYEICTSIEGIHNPIINIHIISGLCGNVGSGSFLDVCYLIRDILKEQKLCAKVYGYFFLPDVTLGGIPYNSNVRNNLLINGYAALQELDHCMHLPSSEASLVQEYKNSRKISWDIPPVDMCHLISSMSEKQLRISDSYNHALSTTAKYLVNIIVHRQDLRENSTSVLRKNKVTKNGQSDPSYYTIGVSELILPSQKIYAYLLSVFVKYLGELVDPNTFSPTIADTDRFLDTIFSDDDSDKRDFYHEISDRIQSMEIHNLFRFCDWQSVLANGDHDLMDHYEKQIKNCIHAMKNEADEISSTLQIQLNKKLANLSSDLNAGPDFAFQLLTNCDYGLLQAIESLIRANERFRNADSKSSSFSQYEHKYDSACKKAKIDFENRHTRRFFDSDERRFQDYEDCLERKALHKIFLYRYYLLDEILRDFHSCASDILTTYQHLYSTLKSMSKDFKSVASSTVAEKESNDNSELIALKNLIPDLDKEIRNLNPQIIFHGFISRLLIWMTAQQTNDNDNAMAESLDLFITEYMNDVLKDITNHYTLDEFLKKRYPQQTKSDLSHAGYQDMYKSLYEKTLALFPYERHESAKSRTAELVFVSYPASSSICHNTAAYCKQRSDSRINFYENLSDHYMSCIKVQKIPSLKSYALANDYSNVFYADNRWPGLHLYEFPTDSTTENWTQLPPFGSNYSSNPTRAASARPNKHNLTHETNQTTRTATIPDFTRKKNEAASFFQTEANGSNNSMPEHFYKIRKARLTENYIFISYAHKDSAIVLPILEKLSQKGYAIWYDDQIPGAANWINTIAKHIKQCSFFIAFLSPDYQDSEYCLKEIVYATNKKKNILPIFLEEYELNSALDFLLTDPQRLFFFQYSEDVFFQKLSESEGIKVCQNEHDISLR